ncbi:MAG: hypothetical protein IPP71_23025 [Bacteroidetes bacterium]|nr:hypothetical protein [Bacteroidota bacterium]
MKEEKSISKIITFIPIRNTICCFFLLVIGCTNSATQKSITFNNEIAPIIHKNCTPCHRPGEAGPFSLVTYEDTRKRQKQF